MLRVKATASDPNALERALRNDLQVELALDSPPADNVAPTEERFPFVQHLACAACLSSDDSPSAHLNLKFEQLAREVSPAFHMALKEMARVTVKIGRIVDAAEGKGLDRGSDGELQSLFQEQRRILADFLQVDFRF